MAPTNPFASATDIAAAIQDRIVSSRELLELYLDRVERFNPALNAIVTLDANRARSEADAADAAIARGDQLGPLHGVPITIKDAIETAGMRTTSGAKMLAEYVPAQDAVAVARLRAAGAIVFGKTNLPEFAGDAQTFNALFGTTNNPWDPERTPGGSSGGAAAAVATGLTGMELGSDLGGSLRIPAQFCGVYTIKPTWGIVPMTGHIPPPPDAQRDVDVGVIGPLTGRLRISTWPCRSSLGRMPRLASRGGSSCHRPGRIRCPGTESRSGSTIPAARSTAKRARSMSR